MDDQRGKRLVVFPEFTDADGRLIKIGMKDRGFRFTVGGKVGKSKWKVKGDTVISACLDFAPAFFTEPLEMVGNAVLFRGGNRQWGQLESVYVGRSWP